MCAAINMLKASPDFVRVSKQGQKIHFPSFIFLAQFLNEERPLRLGLTASRKVGNAVMRNRAKRRLKEVVRTSEYLEKLTGWDIVLIAKTSSQERAFDLMKSDFRQALHKIGVLV
jgi:ribonuclease P protein component